MKLMLSYLWLTLKKESRQWMMMLSQRLRKVTKPVLLANKVDKCVKDAIEFYNLGLGEYYTFASISGRN
jgi:predicted GTPase